MSKNLIIYYSRTGENYFGGEIKSIDKDKKPKDQTISPEANINKRGKDETIGILLINDNDDYD